MKDGENGKSVNKTRHEVPKTRLTAFPCPSLGSACSSTRRCVRKAHSQSVNLRRKTWWTGQGAGRATPHALRRRCHLERGSTPHCRSCSRLLLPLRSGRRCLRRRYRCSGRSTPRRPLTLHGGLTCSQRDVCRRSSMRERLRRRTWWSLCAAQSFQRSRLRWTPRRRTRRGSRPWRARGRRWRSRPRLSRPWWLGSWRPAPRAGRQAELASDPVRA